MVSVIYKKRARPIVWIARKGTKRHLPASFHCQLIEKLIAIASENCRKTLLGDGEFDGNNLQALLKESWVELCIENAKRNIGKKGYSDD